VDPRPEPVPDPLWTSREGATSWSSSPRAPPRRDEIGVDPPAPFRSSMSRSGTNRWARPSAARELDSEPHGEASLVVKEGRHVLRRVAPDHRADPIVFEAAPMSVRTCAPGQQIPATPAYARLLALRSRATPVMPRPAAPSRTALCVAGRPGVKHGHAFDGAPRAGPLVETRDEAAVSVPRGTRGATTTQTAASSVSAARLEAPAATEPTARRVARSRTRRIRPGSPNRTLYSRTFGALVGQHEPPRRARRVVDAAMRMRRDGSTAVSMGCRRRRRRGPDRRECPCARVRPRRPRRGAWRPGRARGHDVSPVAQRHERAFGPAIPSSITTRRPACPGRRRPRLRLTSRSPRRATRRTRPPLPAAVRRLHHPGPGQRAQEVGGSSTRSNAVASRRHAGFGQHLFMEGFDPSSRAPSARADHGLALGPEPVGQPVDQGPGPMTTRSASISARRGRADGDGWPSGEVPACRGLPGPPPRRRCAPRVGEGVPRAPLRHHEDGREDGATLWRRPRTARAPGRRRPGARAPDLLAKKAT